MIVKIFPASASFKGVSYNTNKVEQNRGELMKVGNFGPLQALETLRPEDYVNYLKMISARNKGVKAPQFHAAISAKGKSYDKEVLTAIATDWLARMGYAAQPYLIIFHRDTANNHVHIVSTRIDREGRKISSAFEHNRAIQNLNQVLGLDDRMLATQDVGKAFSYQFGTKAQFMMILEAMGYKLKVQSGQLMLIKFGKQQMELSLADVLKKANNYQPDAERRVQVKAIFHKYSRQYSTSLYKQEAVLPGGETKAGEVFTSDFAKYLEDKMGIQLLFHSKEGKDPYGYSILDHTSKTVWKGSEITPLAQLIGAQVGGKRPIEGSGSVPAFFGLSEEVRHYYQTLLKAAISNYPDLRQGLRELDLGLAANNKGVILINKATNIAIPVSALLPTHELMTLREQYPQTFTYPDVISPVMLTDDVDDQQIHGMRRRRQRKARTNTR